MLFDHREKRASALRWGECAGATSGQGLAGGAQVFFADDFAVGEGDLAGDAAGEFVVVGDHEDGLALAHHVFEEAEDRVGSAGVEVAGGLVGDEDGRVIGHGAGDGNALLLAAGDFAGQLVSFARPCRPGAEAPWRGLRAGMGWYTLQKSMGSMTFSMHESMGRSWKNWKMTPMLRPRHSAMGPSRRLWMAVPSTKISPVVGRSMPVIMLMSVDLPLPDLPTTATNSPEPMRRSTSSQGNEFAQRACGRPCSRR